MGRISIERCLELDAGHRLLRHGGKCASPHGHRYVVRVTASAEVGEDGMVIDFACLKERLGGWLDVHWDHTMVLEAGDPLILAMYASSRACAAPCGGWPGLRVDPAVGSAVGGGRRACFVLPVAPTAENLAEYLLHVVCPVVLADEIRAGLRVEAVRVEETPNCAAIVVRDE